MDQNLQDIADKIIKYLDQNDSLSLQNLNIDTEGMQQEIGKNTEFYHNCTQYFEFLRKKSLADFNFEDEYYFTMPAISNHQ